MILIEYVNWLKMNLSVAYYPQFFGVSYYFQDNYTNISLFWDGTLIEKYDMYFGFLLKKYFH